MKLENACVLDTETTGFPRPGKPEPQVIELAYIDSGPVGFRKLYKPSVPIDLGALATHHILESELEGHPPASEALQDAPTKFAFWIGHNIDFDWALLGKPPVKRICTLALARRFVSQVDSHSLTAMYYHFNGRNEMSRAAVKQAHSAYDDVLLCRSLLEPLANLAKASTLQDLWAASEDARIPRTMTFGKFAGQPISAVDRGYASWYARQADPDQYVLEAFRREGLLK